MTAMIVLKQTPRGMKLIPVTEIQAEGKGWRGLQMRSSHELCGEVQHIMNGLMKFARPLVQQGKRVDLKQLWDLLLRQYGEDFFPNAKFLTSTGHIPARILITKKG